tara:strand:+ start:520 stop:1161 length:642 start_codon:yes stop_codon:yes gene_type:complete
MNKILLVALLSAGTITANAETDVKGYDLSGQMGVRSNYLWRGIDQNNYSPMGEFNLEYNRGGAFGGVWVGDVDYQDGSDRELDFYAGYNFAPVNGVSFSTGVTHYEFVKTLDRVSNFTEGFVTASYKNVSIEYYFDLDTNVDVQSFYDIKVAVPYIPYVDVVLEYGRWEDDSDFKALNLSKDFGDFTVGMQTLSSARDGHFWDNAVIQVNYNF